MIGGWMNQFGAIVIGLIMNGLTTTREFGTITTTLHVTGETETVSHGHTGHENDHNQHQFLSMWIIWGINMIECGKVSGQVVVCQVVSRCKILHIHL